MLEREEIADSFFSIKKREIINNFLLIKLLKSNIIKIGENS